MNPTGIEGYRDFLARRDGEADLLNRRLANREQFFSAPRSGSRPVGPSRRPRLCSCATCAAGDPNPAWTARCCSCWPPPS